MAVGARVVEEHLRDATEEQGLATHREHADAEELPIQRQREQAEIEVAEGDGQREEESEARSGECPALPGKSPSRR